MKICDVMTFYIIETKNFEKITLDKKKQKIQFRQKKIHVKS